MTTSRRVCAVEAVSWCMRSVDAGATCFRQHCFNILVLLVVLGAQPVRSVVSFIGCRILLFRFWLSVLCS